jgi:hypothetical protein
MAIKGHEDLWVEIQANTFRNWVNEHLRNAPPGVATEMSGRIEVRDLSADLCDGTRLVALVESLQKRRLKTPAVHRRPTNRHHCLENVTAALDAIAADGVKLVNIGEWASLTSPVSAPTHPSPRWEISGRSPTLQHRSVHRLHHFHTPLCLRLRFLCLCFSLLLPWRMYYHYYNITILGLVYWSLPLLLIQC